MTTLEQKFNEGRFRDLGRFQITNGCSASPGHCSGCGSSTGLMVDWGLELDFYGVVYICVDSCLHEIANKLGYYRPDQVDRIKEQVRGLVDAQQVLVEHNKELSDAVDSLSRLRIDLSDPTGPTDLVIPEIAESESKSSGGAETDYEHHGSGEDGPVEQVNEPGSSGVHNDDGVEKLGL